MLVACLYGFVWSFVERRPDSGKQGGEYANQSPEKPCAGGGHLSDVSVLRDLGEFMSLCVEREQVFLARESCRLCTTPVRLDSGAAEREFIKVINQ